MPNSPALYEQEDIQPLNERYLDVNKNVTKFLGKVWADMEHNVGITKRPILLTQRKDIIQFLDSRGSETTANHHQQTFIGRNYKPIQIYPFEIQQAV